MTNWKEIQLADVCIKIGSGATPRGGNSVYLDSGEISLIRSQNVYNSGFSPSGIAYISSEHAKQLENVAVESEDVLLNITGDSVARCCQVPDEILPARVNQHVSIIRPDKLKLWPRYLRYILVSPKMQDYMLGLAHAGATRKALTKGMIESFQIPCPNLNTQKRIAEILGSLDDKIALNRKQNETLEGMARAVFQSWFVDFDPVIDKTIAAGHPIPDELAERGARRKHHKNKPPLPQAIQSLFPDRFDPSPLGPIPKGWKVKSLDNIADFLNGLACQKYPPENDLDSLPVIKIRELRQGITDNTDRATSNVPEKYIIQDGDVLFSWSGSLLVKIWCEGYGVLNQHVFKVSSADYPKWFYYYWTHHHLEVFQGIAADKATTMGHIQRRHLSDAKTLIPDEKLLDKMSKTITPLLDKQIDSELESKTLTQLRSSLLPKLLTGEIEV